MSIMCHNYIDQNHLFASIYLFFYICHPLACFIYDFQDKICMRSSCFDLKKKLTSYFLFAQSAHGSRVMAVCDSLVIRKLNLNVAKRAVFSSRLMLTSFIEHVSGVTIAT